MENRIKEPQLQLFSDRTSCHRWWPNQFRLLLASLAYTLMNTIRRLGLKGSPYARAQCATIRLKLLKIGAVITRNTRRVRLHLSSACPIKTSSASSPPRSISREVPMTATGNWMARLGGAAAAVVLSMTVTTSGALAAEAKGESIEIPFLQTFSGAAAGYGELMMNGAVLGVEIVNKQLGGVKGRPIKLVPSDAPFTDMPAAGTMFKKLARDPKVPALLGISATAILAAVHDQIEQFKIPVFAYDSGGHWRLGKFNPYVWRIIPMAPVGVPVVMSKMQKK